MWKLAFLLLSAVTKQSNSLFQTSLPSLSVPDFKASIPSLPSVPDLKGSIPSLPSVPDLKGSIPSLPSVPDLKGSIPSLPSVPDLKGSIPAVPDLKTLQDSIDITPLIALTPINLLKKGEELVTGFGIFNLGADAEKIEFKLYTSKSNYEEERIFPEKPLSALRTWNKGRKVIIIIHGYTEDGSGGPFSTTFEIVVAYKKANCQENIIFVDWRYLGRQANYFVSAKNTIPAGMRVAELIISLRKNDLITSLDQVHIVGFSLGAHVSGVAAYCCNTMLEGEKIGRVTGLDPAGPGFRGETLINRLDPSDAKFVDVIHTNMGAYLTTFGINIKSGHIDFYPNGGEHQLGCSINTPIIKIGEPVGVCSHTKAPGFFANSILGVKYIGCPCTNWDTYKQGSCQCTKDKGALMGQYVDEKTTGDYYLVIP